MDQGQWLDPEAMARAEAMLAKARKIGPNSERVLMVSAAWLRSQDRCQELIEAAERLISLFPNAPTGYNFLGWCKMVNGHPEEELPLLDKMMQLDPVGPNVSGVYQRMAQDFNHLERSEDAIAMIERALAMNPGMRTEQRGNAYRVLAISHARLGHLDQARHWIEEGNKIRPFDTVRRYHFHGFANEGIERQMRSVREALRLAGLRDHAEEDADFGVKPSLRLHQGLEGQTPTTVPGATTIHTQELIRLIAQSKPLIVDTGYYPTGVSVPGAFELMHAGLAGNLSDTLQDRLRRVMHDLTRGDFAAPIVVVGWNSERFDGANLTVRLLKLGYRNILWVPWWARSLGGQQSPRGDADPARMVHRRLAAQIPSSLAGGLKPLIRTVDSPLFCFLRNRTRADVPCCPHPDTWLAIICERLRLFANY